MNNVRQYLGVLRFSHWFKNLIVLVGSIGAFLYYRPQITSDLLISTVSACFFACIVSSVNYAVNDLTDAKSDLWHPIKKNRAVPRQQISKSSLIIFVTILSLLSFTGAFLISGQITCIGLILLAIAGLIYNIKPLRLKDIPYIDVISESVNNPIRVFIGWSAVMPTALFPPVSLLIIFWASGAALMSAKRYCELTRFQRLKRKKILTLYRSTFKSYTKTHLYRMVLFYCAITLFSYAVFAIDVRVSILILLPVLILYFRWFLSIMTSEVDTTFIEPEKLFVNKPLFSIIGILIFIVFTCILLLAK